MNQRQRSMSSERGDEGEGLEGMESLEEPLRQSKPPLRRESRQGTRIVLSETDKNRALLSYSELRYTYTTIGRSWLFVAFYRDVFFVWFLQICKHNYNYNCFMIIVIYLITTTKITDMTDNYKESEF